MRRNVPSRFGFCRPAALGARIVCAAFALGTVIATAGGASAAEVPNRSYTPDQEGTLISTGLGTGFDHNQPSIVNGHLLLAGNGTFHVFDITDPFSPVEVAFFESEFNDGEAESHAISFARDADGTTWAVSISGHGVDIWDLTDMTAPAHVTHVTLDGIDYGDNTSAVWGVSWQGQYIYVGGTDTGLHVIDAADPANASVVARVPTAEMGDVPAGPLYALGNLLVVTTPKNRRGVVTLDISDPAAPSLLDFFVPEENAYIGGFFGRYAYLVHPLRVYDVTTDPRDIQELGKTYLHISEYLSFGDGFLFQGAIRPTPGVHRVDISDPANPVILQYIEGRRDDPLGGVFTDDQFPLPVGNLVVMSDDEINIGSAIAVWDSEPDSRPPEVSYVNPPDGATLQATTSRIAVSFTDQIDLASVGPESFIVRPVDGGEALSGCWGHLQTIVTFDPDEDLEPNTTYEIVLAAGGVTDLVGNGIAEEQRFLFSTGEDVASLPCTVTPDGPAEVGASATLATSSMEGAMWEWDFGDGTEPTSTGATSVEHSYAAPGRYPVTVTVSLDGRERTCSAVQIVHHPLLDARPASSGTVAVDAASGLVWVTNSDAGTVTAVGLDDGLVAAEIAVGDDPGHVAVSPSGMVWVAVQGEDAIAVIDPASFEVVQRVDTGWGTGPFGVAFEPDNTRAFVTLQHAGALLVLDAGSGAIIERVALAPDAAMPAQVRGLAAVEGSRVLVSRYVSVQDHGEVYVVDVGAEPAVVEAVTLASSPGPDTTESGRGVPNWLQSIAVSPDGRGAWIPATTSNVERGDRRDGQSLNTTNTVRTVVMALDLDADTPSEDAASRIDLDDHDSAVAVALSEHGDLVFVASRGTNRVDVFDTASGALVAGFATPLGPNGLALDDDGRLWVSCFTSRTLVAYDVSGLLAATDARVQRLMEVQTVAEEPLTEQELLGQQIFHNANSGEMSQDGYISCASCHAEGGHDGMVWDFSDRGEGFRNTIDLRGRAGTGHGPVHWTGNFDEIHDFENDIRLAFGGRGLMADADFEEGTRSEPLGDPKEGVSARLDALAAYVATFDAFPRSPFRAPDGTLTDAAERGLRVFAELDCLGCHTGDALTDSGAGGLHDVGTLSETSGERLGEPLTGIDTPTLHGLWASPPYLHDGSAATVEDTLRIEGHGNAQELPDADMADLVTFLLSLEGESYDYDALEPWPGEDVGVDVGVDTGADVGVDTDYGAKGQPGRGCATAAGGSVPGVVWLMVVLGAIVRRRRVAVTRAG